MVQTLKPAMKHGPAKVGLGLAGLAILIILWQSGRSLFTLTGWVEPAVIIALFGCLALRELGGLPQRWWATPAAATYLLLWSLTRFAFALGSLLLIAVAGLMAWVYLRPLHRSARAWGLDWRHAMHGYRRVVLLGASVAFLSLFLSWFPEVRTPGWFSGGYVSHYSADYGKYVNQWNYTQYYNPGFYSPAYRGIGLSGSLLLEVAILGSLLYAACVPRFAVPKWYRYLPLITAGYGLLFTISHFNVDIGEGVFLIGLGLVAWGGYQVGVTGEVGGRKVKLPRR